jgi:pimeloyl-ACP methyl ester carboxylesterase
MKNYFLKRGYTLVVPMRRGRGESTGFYIEECAFPADPSCTRMAYFRMGTSGLQSALADSLSVIDQVVPKLAPRASKIVLAGHSRGGFLSLAIAAARPKQVAAVINFSGGWFGVGRDKPKEEETARLEMQEQSFQTFGASFKGPTLWIYAPDDPFYSEEFTRRFYGDYVRAGGQADYLSAREHTSVDPHWILDDESLWSQRADQLLGITGPGSTSTK